MSTVDKPDRKSWDTAALPVGKAKAVAVRQMFDTIAPRYDLVNRIMTFRLDVRWRRSTVAALALGDGALVLDVASGTGDLCRELSRQRRRTVGKQCRVQQTLASPGLHEPIVDAWIPRATAPGAYAIRD